MGRNPTDEMGGEKAKRRGKWPIATDAGRAADANTHSTLRFSKK
jgi:hypothetical protein